MLLIAEIGLNYNGNNDLAYEMIKQAKYAGADIVKFQLGWRQKPDEINHMTGEKLVKLRKWSDYFGVEFMVSIFTEEAFELSKEVDFKRYKIASRTVKDSPALVEKILKEGKETIISLGMWEGSELPFQSYKNVKYLWCRSQYPTYPEQMTDFPKDFKNSPYHGYSDHTIGIETALIAIARGAEIVEKHFTLDKSNTTIRDHALSATPDEFRQLALIGKDIYKKINIGV